jgi:hypothetical protein
MQGKQTSRVVNNVMMVIDRFSNNGMNVISSKQMTKGHGSRLRHSCQSLTWKLTGKRVWAIKVNSPLKLGLIIFFIKTVLFFIFIKKNLFFVRAL